MKNLLPLFLIIHSFCISQSLSEYQLIDWENNHKQSYNKIQNGQAELKKDKENYQLFTTNSKVNQLVCDSIDNLRLRLGLRPGSISYQTNWVNGLTLDFCEMFSDSLNQPVILRIKNSGDRCKVCAKSIFDVLKKDSSISSIIKNKRLKKYSTLYFQSSLDGEWSSSFIIFCYKMRWGKTEIIGYELPDDLR